jgi:hypothetical protein
MNVMKTERLRLEPLDESRLEEFLALTADPNIHAVLGAGWAVSA